MLHLSSLHKAFGERILFSNLNWNLQEGDRVGLCGPNGAGKTTLLKMLAGKEPPDDGTITRPNNLSIGYLPQDGLTHRDRTLFEETSLAFSSLLELRSEMKLLEIELSDKSADAEQHDAILLRYSELQDAFHTGDGYDIDSKVNAVLLGLGFKSKDLKRKTETFSGGWQMRIALAKLLLRSPDLLLLDEPTNHLDLEARNWLEDFLVSYPKAIVLVSHDRFFLDTVVTSIADVGLKTLTAYPGTYGSYLVEREKRLSRLRESKRQQDEEISRMRAFIERFRYKSTKARQVQSRIKMLGKIVPIDVPPKRQRVHFTFPISARSGRLVLTLSGVTKRYGDIRVFNGANVHIERGDRIALVGPNGSGKSTLMRILSGVETPDSGTRTLGHNVVMQYFAQDEATRLDGNLTVYESLTEGSPVDMVPAIRSILGGFLFTEDDVYKNVRVLSGGERTRLAVARMLLRSSNVLLLDEPTNHLDIDSTDVLLDALNDYGGTLIFVSHDRYFVDKLANKVLEIGMGGAALYPGTYEEFRWMKDNSTSSRTAVTHNRSSDSAVRQKPQNSVPVRSAKEHKQEQVATRRHERQLKSLHNRITDLEQRIGDFEEQIRQAEMRMAEPDFYDDKSEAQGTIEQHQQLMWKVGELMNQWEALEQEASRRTSSIDEANDT